MTSKEKYLAHKIDQREQILSDHLEGTARLSSQFASAFGREKQGEMAGYLHDIGKHAKEFQKRIRNPESTKKCDHATAGALEAFHQGQLDVAMCILGHHGGLLDLGGSRDGSEDKTVQGRIKKGREGKIPDYSAWESTGLWRDFSDVPKMDASQTAFSRYIEVKMLYSSLVDADFLDTEAFMEEKAVPRGEYDTMAELRERLDLYLRRKNWLIPQTGINGMRTEILETAARKGRALGRGIYTLTVPTGGGKTLSSLRFGLEHAVEHGLDRIIYVIPYVNIIEQTAEKFREILGKKNVLEHHSHIIPEKEEERRLALASENWEMPVILTTAVQFFESLFHNKPSRCRKLHNIANSVIIYDEIQMLPVKHWIPCVQALEELSGSCRATQILCTATQPAITFPGKTVPLEIVENKKRYYGAFQRVTFKRAGLLSLEYVAGKIMGREQTLCIVNTKTTAQKLFQILPEAEGIFHLSTMMVPAHRKEVLGNIQKRLQEGKGCRVIATSLVEAGVDLDFAYVMREQAGLDSILQAAGRCNRNGKRNIRESIVEIFSLDGQIPSSIGQQVSAARYVMREFEEWDSLEAIEAYFQFWRNLRGEKNLDQKEIMKKVNRYAFCEIAKDFRLIEEDTYTIYIPWKEEGKKHIDRLRKGICNKELFRDLGRYGVNVFAPHYRELVERGDVEFIHDMGVLTNIALYQGDTGLKFQEREGMAIFC
ncbi:MAG: CRISPR-associated helicase Cas3' [Lachnospiraceae bacterium]|jgi:CRISPR-associated endonuclease/helicase Cas3|nr:CRISPR-associated helicase Cas3' [Lachnospiraceae bacterium]MCI8997114.1 CRISPR-associated helicase Cas3' [Lachnospiraceae bacterium]